jgi:hypothetical protein
MQAKIITPAINHYQHEMSSQTTNGTSFNKLYRPVLPHAIDVFTEIRKLSSVETIKDNGIKFIVQQIVNAFYDAVENIYNENNYTDYYLPRLHIVEQTEQIEKSVLVEWNFHKLRIGFDIYKPPEDSYYYFVKKSDDSFLSKSITIRDNIGQLANESVQYVMRNMINI